jgi:hypothetical protein
MIYFIQNQHHKEGYFDVIGRYLKLLFIDFNLIGSHANNVTLTEKLNKKNLIHRSSHGQK